MMVTRVLIVTLLTVLSGCVDPDGTRPGMGLTGEVQTTPADWEFTNEHQLVAIEVQTPYLLPHSVTIWCVSREGRLYVAARAPDTKNWPAWVERDVNVRLKIASDVYEVQLARLNDEAVAVLKKLSSGKPAKCIGLATIQRLCDVGDAIPIDASAGAEEHGCLHCEQNTLLVKNSDERCQAITM